MTIIWFNVQEAMNQLTEFGEVYTLRDHWKQEGIAMLLSSLSGKPYYKGKVRLVFVTKIDMPNTKDLEIYVHKSGFKDIIEWLSHIKGHPEILYLYYVERIPEVIPLGSQDLLI